MFDTLKKTKKKLLSSTSGSFGIIAAFLIPAMLIAIGAAIDLTRAQQAKTRMEIAVDSATLAAAKMMANNATQADAEKKAEEYFLANVAGQGLTRSDFKTFSFKVNPLTNKINASVVADYKTKIMGFAGFKSVDVGVSSETEFGQRTVEVAFVLDTTGSMRGSRMEDLQDAVKNAIDVLIPKGTPPNNQKVRISLVPYADAVNLGSNYQFKATGGNINANNCVAEREKPKSGANFQYADVAPLIKPITTSERNRYFPLDPKITQRTDQCPTVPLRPLTNDADKLKQDVEDLVARGFTAGQNGIQWGLNTISGNYTNFWETQDAPKPYGEKDLDKYLIVMTDGAFNTAYYDWENYEGKEHWWRYRGRTASASNKAALKLCDIAKEKDKGITVYTIAFKAGKSAESTLRNCATTRDKHFFKAGNGDALNAAFNKIAQEIKRILLTS